METDMHFREIQRFRQPWLWGLLGAQALLAAVDFGRGKRSGREVLGRLAAVGAAALLLRVATLHTEVRDDGVYVKFAPLHRSYRRIPFADLSDL